MIVNILEINHWCIFIKLGTHVANGVRMNPIDSFGQSKVKEGKVRMDKYWNNLVKMIQTK